jgi:hypothetical protein
VICARIIADGRRHPIRAGIVGALAAAQDAHVVAKHSGLRPAPNLGRLVACGVLRRQLDPMLAPYRYERRSRPVARCA